MRTEPLAFDHFDKRRLYFGSNVVFATTNGGQSWHAISPDLTRAHPAVPAVIQSFESDDPQHGAHRGVVYALAPSYVRAGTMWAGTDDGLVWITRDSGRHWKNVTPPGLTRVEQDRADRRVALRRQYRIRRGQPFSPRRLASVRLRDARWRRDLEARRRRPAGSASQRCAPRSGRAASALRRHGKRRGRLVRRRRAVAIAAAQSPAHVRARSHRARQRRRRRHARPRLLDPRRRRTAARASCDARHGDASSLRRRSPIACGAARTPTRRCRRRSRRGRIRPTARSSTTRWVRRRGASSFRSSTTGIVVRRYASDDRPPPPIEHLDKPAYWERPFTRPSTGAGMHRFVWDLREAPPRSLQPDLPISAVPHDTPRVPEGVLVVPGRYTVRLDVEGRTVERPLVVAMDPRVAISRAALEQQYRLARRSPRSSTAATTGTPPPSTPTPNRCWTRSRARMRRRRCRR